MTKQIEVEQIPKYNKINLNPENKKDHHSIDMVKKNRSVKQNNRRSITESRIIISDEHAPKSPSPITMMLLIGGACLGSASFAPSPNRKNQNRLKKHKSNFWKSKYSWFSEISKLL